MRPNFRIDRLEKLLKSFYTLTKIRILIYDDNFNEIVGYPMSDCEFCRFIKGTKDGNNKCLKSNLQAFKKCYQSEELYVYKCHAGLIEAMIHLRIKDTIVGYIMFGQISDIEDEELRYKNIILENNFNENSSKIKEIINSLKYLSDEEIQSAKTILLALAKYTVSEKLVSVRKEKFRLDIDNYLESFYNNADLKIEDITMFLHMSRSNLYNAAEKYLGMGIARYIKLFRIEKAKSLLLESDDSIVDIAYKVGFNDYNYFCRVFKSEVGKSAKKFKSEFNK